MNWEKRGLIYCPDGRNWWAKHYAHLPTAHVLDDRIRVYYAGLDENNFGRIGYVDLAKDNPSQILYIAPEPILELGDLGTFDDCGLVPSDIIVHEGKIYLYYIGFQRAERVPYMLFAGLAISEDGINFERYSRTPILDRTDKEPFLRSATTLIVEDDLFKMWYVSANKWTTVDEKLYPEYIIRHAQSKDGIHWETLEPISVDLADDEFGLGRPWAIKDGDTYRLWYSIRSRTRPYRMGYAESKDGIHWERKDEKAGIYASETGWDSEMICYANVVKIQDQWIMFYNGNQHGRTGFGYAIGAKDLDAD